MASGWVVCHLAKMVAAQFHGYTNTEVWLAGSDGILRGIRSGRDNCTTVCGDDLVPAYHDDEQVKRD